METDEAKDHKALLQPKPWDKCDVNGVSCDLAPLKTAPNRPGVMLFQTFLFLNGDSIFGACSMSYLFVVCWIYWHFVGCFLLEISLVALLRD